MMGSQDRPQWITWLAVLMGLTLFALLSPNPAAAEDAEDGKTLYVKSGCNKCHTIITENIELSEDDAEEEEEEEDPFAEEDESEPEDLSGIGARWTHGEDGMMKWLTKKLEIEENLHKKKFPGSKTELKLVSAWLMTLKEEAPAE